MAALQPSSYRHPEPPADYDVRPRLESEQEYFTEIALQESQRWIEVLHVGNVRRPVERGGGWGGGKGVSYPGPRSVGGAPQSLGGEAACRGPMSDCSSTVPQTGTQRAWMCASTWVLYARTYCVHVY